MSLEDVHAVELTFRGGVRAIRSDLSHPSAVAAERNQPGDDGSLPKAYVANDHHSSVNAGVGALQLSIDLVEHPVAANEDGLGGDAGNLEEQWFQRDVRRSVRCKANCKGTQGQSLWHQSKTIDLKPLFNLP